MKNQLKVNCIGNVDDDELINKIILRGKKDEGRHQDLMCYMPNLKTWVRLCRDKQHDTIQWNANPRFKGEIPMPTLKEWNVALTAKDVKKAFSSYHSAFPFYISGDFGCRAFVNNIIKQLIKQDSLSRKRPV
ncbi:hypothetical protein [Ekhidna sp.]|uniref:hypothetical protein n=1 Tax=Ekhidna sp. TaxID=2608089 RepID=UPI00329738E4